jgi:hypothetical protein
MDKEKLRRRGEVAYSTLQTLGGIAVADLGFTSVQEAHTIGDILIGAPVGLVGFAVALKGFEKFLKTSNLLGLSKHNK